MNKSKGINTRKPKNAKRPEEILITSTSIRTKSPKRFETELQKLIKRHSPEKLDLTLEVK